MAIGERTAEKPQTHHNSTGIYVYLGDSDPYCYFEVTYEDFWFVETDIETHCQNEMANRGCILISNSTLDTHIQFLRLKKTLTCLGLRTSITKIHSGLYGWSLVYQLEDPLFTTYHGNFKMVFVNNTVFQIHADYIRYSLTYDGKFFNNAVLYRTRRTWVHKHWIIVAHQPTLKKLISSTFFFKINRSKVFIVNTAKGSCNTILNIGQVEIINNKEYFTNSDGTFAVGLTCGAKICLCHPDLIPNMIDKTPEKALQISEETGLIHDIISGIKNLFLSLFNWTFSEVFGDDWVSKLWIMALIYYFVMAATGSSLFALAASGLIVLTELF